MIVGGYTATGPREVNEDNYYIKDFSGINSFSNGVKAFVMVSDGMGGYQGGDVASGLAVACAKSYLDQLLDLARDNQLDLDAPAALREITANAHEAIVAESQTIGNTVMGATFVGAFVSDTHAWIGHVGDSRAYLIRAGEATQLTEDHSHVGRMLSRGVITEEEAQNHPDRNKIERALGFTAGDCDINEVDLLQDDSLLLCSDGVYTTMRANELAQCVNGSANAMAIAEKAVKLALNKGTDDNSTAVVLLNCDEAPRQKKRRRRQRTLAGTEATMVREAVVDTQQDTQSRPVDNPYIKPYVRRSQRRGPGNRMNLKHILIPVICAALLVGVSVFLGLRACSDQSTMVPPSASSISNDNAGQRDKKETTQNSNESSSTTKENSGTNTEKVTARMNFSEQEIPWGSDVEIKYVDIEGQAQRFSYPYFALEDSQLPTLRQGSLVSLSEEANSFGRDRKYQALAAAYLRMLKEDVQNAIDGATTFDSELAGIVGAEKYQQFVQALTQHSQELESITYLVIDELPKVEDMHQTKRVSQSGSGTYAESSSGGDSTVQVESKPIDTPVISG
ncbi:MAG: protein phosphatase 2C domain-containing protein [Coriobacteriales bacterium]|nr:protein phosphatase 2C domain-containing protein [Coriobacteriales bacterium]